MNFWNKLSKQFLIQIQQLFFLFKKQLSNVTSCQFISNLTKLEERNFRLRKSNKNLMAKYVLIKDVLRVCSGTIVPSLVRKTAEMICVKWRQGSACSALMDGKGNFAIKVRDVSLNV